MEYRHLVAATGDQYQIGIYETGARPRYFDILGAQQSFPASFPSIYDCALFTDKVCWHYVKLVVDFTLREYVKCIIDDLEYDMRGIRGYDISPSSNQNLLEVFLYGGNGGAATACLTLFDELIVTEEEP